MDINVLSLEEEAGLEKFRRDLKAGKNSVVIDKGFQNAYEQSVIEEMRPYFAALEKWRWESSHSDKIF